MSTENEGDIPEYPDSGPFCRHWSQIGECDEACETCGHSCYAHSWHSKADHCDEEGCACEKWMPEVDDE